MLPGPLKPDASRQLRKVTASKPDLTGPNGQCGMASIPGFGTQSFFDEQTSPTAALFDKPFPPGHLGINPQGAINFHTVLVAQTLVQTGLTAPDAHKNTDLVNFRAPRQQATVLQSL